MGLPSKRRTSRSKKERAAHFALDTTMVSACPSCQSPILPHRACGTCGTYRGKKVVDATKRAERSIRRAKKKSK